MDLMIIYKDVFDVAEEKRKSNFSKFFPYRKEAEFKKKIDALYEKYYEIAGSYEYDSDTYALATQELVSGLMSNKDTFIAVYKTYNQFMYDEYGLEINISYPPIPVSNTFERLMFIAKYLQNKDNKVSDLESILWSSDRTIEKDLAKLQDNDGDPLQVCGQKFVINGIERSRGHVTFESTAHPFFLTCNLTQVIAALEGLRMMSERQEFYGYAMPMARNIWKQLSDYGKQRIFDVMGTLLSTDTVWYKSLDREEERAYQTEKECCVTGGDILMYCLKGNEERLCNIEYKDGKNSEFLTDVKVINYNEDGWRVCVDGKERILKPQRIIKSSFHKENMF